MSDQDGDGAAQDARVIQSTRFLDRQRNPPDFVDEELPTTTVVLRGPIRRGLMRAPRGTIPGSYRITGSYYPFSRGTYSLRVTRLSVFSGSRGNSWFVRHSRTGTADVINFPSPGQETRLGGPNEPIYAFGPGTVIYGFLGNAAGSIGSAYSMGMHLEGLTS